MKVRHSGSEQTDHKPSFWGYPDDGQPRFGVHALQSGGAARQGAREPGPDFHTIMSIKNDLRPRSWTTYAA